MFPGLSEQCKRHCTEKGKENKSHPDIESLEAIAGGGPQSHHFRACVSDAYLEITVCVFLFQNDPNGLFYVNKKTPWRTSNAFLVVR